MTRTAVVSSESSYGLHASDGADPVPDTAVRRAIARDLLFKDSYHFGKTAAVSTRSPDWNRTHQLFTTFQRTVDTAAPYQHPEMFAALAYFFKGREAVGILYKESMPTGIHGTQIPDAMLALTATAVSTYPAYHRLTFLTHPTERFRLPLKNSSQEGPHLLRRRLAARSIGTTSPRFKL